MFPSTSAASAASSALMASDSTRTQFFPLTGQVQSAALVANALPQAHALSIAPVPHTDLPSVLAMFDSMGEREDMFVMPRYSEADTHSKEEEHEEEEATEHRLSKRDPVGEDLTFDDLLDTFQETKKSMQVLERRIRQMRTKQERAGAGKTTSRNTHTIAVNERKPNTRTKKNTGPGRRAIRCEPCFSVQYKCEGGIPGKSACDRCNRLLSRPNCADTTAPCCWTTVTAQNYMASAAGRKALSTPVSDHPSYIKDDV